ncbi:MAG: hypothetical protein JXA66_01480 [Oligoflexia bacterium]|nr:hypothetical protein [Oligoflexia bacterium]
MNRNYHRKNDKESKGRISEVWFKFYNGGYWRKTIYKLRKKHIIGEYKEMIGVLRLFI